MFNISRGALRKRLVAASVIAVAVTLFTVPAHAAGGDLGDPEQVHENVVGDQLVLDNPAPTTAEAGTSATVSVRTASYVITCRITANNPHISEGANGVIFKSRVVCTGTGSYPPKATIRVRGALMFDYATSPGDTSGGINWYAIRSSDETRTVSVNGTTNTFYTPRLGTSGAGSTGHYQGSSTVEIITPAGQKVGSDISGVVWYNP